MRHEIQERICDECGKTQQMKMIQRVRSTPFHGWIRATIEGRDGLTSSFDFCSAKCFIKHFSEFKMNPTIEGGAGIGG